MKIMVDISPEDYEYLKSYREFHDTSEGRILKAVCNGKDAMAVIAEVTATVLTELQSEVEEMDSREHECNFATPWCIDKGVVVEIIQEKINALKGVEIDKAKWKPFDSTIPLEDGDYLVTYEDPQTHKLQVLIARYHMAVHEEDECKFYDDSEVEITLAVKAWQPLPEPYMEDD